MEPKPALLSPGAPRMNKCSPQIRGETRSFCADDPRSPSSKLGDYLGPHPSFCPSLSFAACGPPALRRGGLGLPGTSWAPSVSIPLWRRLFTCSPAPKPLRPMVTAHCHAARFLLFTFSHHVRTWTSHGICFSRVPFVLPKEEIPSQQQWTPVVILNGRFSVPLSLNLLAM